ncbi:MAG: SCO family protein [Verrucomicrobiota bacterium]|nr:SCO family protein [Verrucomicrobiota bacterium]
MVRLNFLKIGFVLLSLIFFTACHEKKVEKSVFIKPVGTNRQTFQVKGVIKELKPDGKTATIKHETIPDYMPAMTMDFEVKNSNELKGFKAGDAISFRMVVADDQGWIEQLKKIGAASPAEFPSRETIRVARDVEPLKIGDILPEYHFTNELGQSVNLSQFKGNAIAFTFIFTTCPFPNFCPRMSSNFAETQKKLSEIKNSPTNWHLFSISFDPEKDVPEVLKTYAQKYKYDPRHWSFLTGELIDITAIAQQFGQTFWREGESINHNLRTVVIDASGRVTKIIPNEKWTSDELVEEIVKAAGEK